jgi:superfamily I DNA and/or RNA helicase
VIQGRFQGGAKDIIILSMVVSVGTVQAIVSQNKEGIDKMNVALTRAKGS